MLEGIPDDTPQAVLDQAIGLDIELIVLGSRRRGRPSVMARPGVTEELARHTRCPIVTVPPVRLIGSHDEAFPGRSFPENEAAVSLE